MQALKLQHKVRRAMANVPTYMMWDDHEVTDDWNLNPMWRDRVMTNPLGRAIIRNGMLAFALFQGWGNDPEKYTQGKPKRLLELATQLFTSTSTRPPSRRRTTKSSSCSVSIAARSIRRNSTISCPGTIPCRGRGISSSSSTTARNAIG